MGGRRLPLGPTSSCTRTARRSPPVLSPRSTPVRPSARLEGKIGDADVQRLIDAAVMPAWSPTRRPTSGEPMVADAGTTTITVVADGQTHTTSVYALDIATATSPRVDQAAVENRQRAADFVSVLASSRRPRATCTNRSATGCCRCPRATTPPAASRPGAGVALPRPGADRDAVHGRHGQPGGPVPGGVPTPPRSPGGAPRMARCSRWRSAPCSRTNRTARRPDRARRGRHGRLIGKGARHKKEQTMSTETRPRHRRHGPPPLRRHRRREAGRRRRLPPDEGSPPLRPHGGRRRLPGQGGGLGAGPGRPRPDA